MDEFGRETKKRIVKIRKRLEDQIEAGKRYEESKKTAGLAGGHSAKGSKHFMHRPKSIASKMDSTVYSNRSKNSKSKSGKDTNESRTEEMPNKNMTSMVDNEKNQKDDSDPEDEEYYEEPEIEGSQLRLSKKHLTFTAVQGTIACDSIWVENIGNTVVFYEWRKVKMPNLHQSCMNDMDSRFFCHYSKYLLKPGESRNFIFSFKSDIHGIFNEAWELYSDPKLVEPLQPILLAGHSLTIDTHREFREGFDKKILDDFVWRSMKEIVSDIVDDVRTTDPPPPDLFDPEVCRVEFEERNAPMGLWYYGLAVSMFRYIYEEVERCKELKMQRRKEREMKEKLESNIQEPVLTPEEEEKLEKQKRKEEEEARRKKEEGWDLNVEQLGTDIEEFLIFDEAVREAMKDLFEDMLELCRKRPFSRSPLYQEISDVLCQTATQITDLADQMRKELDLGEYVFVDPENVKEEVQVDPKAAKKAPVADPKKGKRKFKNEEEEKAFMDEYKMKLAAKAAAFSIEKIDAIDQKRGFVEFTEGGYTRKALNEEETDLLSRKKEMRNVDMESKRVLIRAHLALKEPEWTRANEEYAAALRAAEEEKERAANEKQGGKAAAKGNQGAKGASQPAKSQNPKGSFASQTMISGQSAPTEQPVLSINFIRPESLEKLIDTIKHLAGSAPRMVFLMISAGPKAGRDLPAFSIGFLADFLRDNLDLTLYTEPYIIEEWTERLETDYYPEGSYIMFPNAFSIPEEIGFRTTENPETSVIEMDSLQWKECQQFANRLSEYANVFINIDKENFFSEEKLTSHARMMTGDKLMGPEIKQALDVILDSVVNPPMTILMGGSVAPLKFLVLEACMGLTHDIFLGGQMAIAFILARAKDVITQINGMRLDSRLEKAVQRVQALASESAVNLHFPEELIALTEINQSGSTAEMSQEQWEAILKKSWGMEVFDLIEEKQKMLLEAAEKQEVEVKGKQPPARNQPNKPGPPAPSPEAEKLVLNVEDLTVIRFSDLYEADLFADIQKQRSILWIGSMVPFPAQPMALADHLDVRLARVLFDKKVQEETKPPEPVYDGGRKKKGQEVFRKLTISLVGSDLLALNEAVLKEEPPKKKRRRRSSEDDQDEEERDELDENGEEDGGVSEEEENEGEEEELEDGLEGDSEEGSRKSLVKKTNLDLISDKFSPETEFVLHFISGKKFPSKTKLISK